MAQSQADAGLDSVKVDRILIEGNKKTKEAYILREMGIKVGDRIPVTDLQSTLVQSRSLLQNTGLFNDIQINIAEWDEVTHEVTLVVELSESWYIFPIPILSLADRSFNVWWKVHNRDINRLNYGINFIWVNFSGVNDKIKLNLQGGYRRRVRLQYDRPYINRQKTLGFSARYEIVHQREFQFETRGNKQQFYRDEEQLIFRRQRAIFGMSYRPGVVSSHGFLVKYERNRIDPEASDLNPGYFLNGADQQRYFQLSYSFVRERRDNKFYALRGTYLGLSASKEGLGIFSERNKFLTEGTFAHFWPITEKINLETRLKARKEWVQEAQPYFGLTALGYGETFVRGYELYIVDGTDYVLSQNSLRFRIFSKVFNFGKIIPLETYRKFPIDVYFTVNGDFGYARNDFFNEENPLNNRWLRGGGIGLDFVLYTKYAFQFEYSRNHFFKEGGIFLNYRTRI